jgi:hypothetical protein
MGAKTTAVGLYAVLDRDPMDFIEFVQEADTDDEVLWDLYLMLAMDNPKHSADTKNLNGIGASVVQRELDKRGLPLPAMPEK